MSLFPSYRYRFFNDPFDRFYFNRFDFYDPWFDFDQFPPLLPTRPRFQRAKEHQYTSNSTVNSTQGRELTPRTAESEKFRIQVNVDGFNPDAIKHRVEGRTLIVEGKQEDRRRDRDVTIRELREIFNLPAHVDPNRLTSYVTPNNMLVIESPTERQLEQIKNDDQNLTRYNLNLSSSFNQYPSLNGSNFQPRVLDQGNQKQLELTVGVKNYSPQEINVSVKDNKLIVRGEHQSNDGNRSERSSFFQSTTLPPGTQVEQLQSHLNDDGQLRIEAPIA